MKNFLKLLGILCLAACVDNASAGPYYAVAGGSSGASPMTGSTVSTIAADDTTPDVSAGGLFVTSANTVATAITDLDSPSVGIIWICGGSNTNSTTIADSGNFNLDNTYGTFTASLDSCLELYIQADNDYIEVNRTVMTGLAAMKVASIIAGDGTTFTLTMSDENLTFADGGANRIDVSTTTGVDILNFGSLYLIGKLSALDKKQYIGLQSTNQFLIYSEIDTATGAYLDIYTNSASPADGDTSYIKFRGKASSGTADYSQITSEIQDPTDTSEEGILRLSVTENAVLTEYMRLDGTDGLTRATFSKNVEVPDLILNDDVYMTDMATDAAPAVMVIGTQGPIAQAAQPTNDDGGNLVLQPHSPWRGITGVTYADIAEGATLTASIQINGAMTTCTKTEGDHNDGGHFDCTGAGSDAACVTAIKATYTATPCTGLSVSVVAGETLGFTTTAGAASAFSIVSSDGDIAIASGVEGFVQMAVAESDLTAGACLPGTWVMDTGGAARELCHCNTGGTAFDCITVTTANGPTD